MSHSLLGALLLTAGMTACTEHPPSDGIAPRETETLPAPDLGAAIDAAASPDAAATSPGAVPELAAGETGAGTAATPARAIPIAVTVAPTGAASAGAVPARTEAQFAAGPRNDAIGTNLAHDQLGKGADAGTTSLEREDGSGASNWTVYDATPGGATVTVSRDPVLGSDVVVLAGAGLQNGFRLGGTGSGNGGWNETTRSVLSWKMRASERFRVYVAVRTTDGFRYLIYDDRSEAMGLTGGLYVHHGLGDSAVSDRWIDVSRDLGADIASGDPGNALVAVHGLFVRGNVRLDDVVSSEPPAGSGASTRHSASAAGPGRTVPVVLEPVGNAASTTRELDMSPELWTVYDADPIGAAVTATTAPVLDEPAIALSGTGMDNGFRIGNTSPRNGGWNETERPVLLWKMRASERFRIYAAVQTTRGFRYLIYDDRSEDLGFSGGLYVHHGLGAKAVSDRWVSVERDLSADLSSGEPGNTLVAVHGLFVRGNVLLGSVARLDETDSSRDGAQIRFLGTTAREQADAGAAAEAPVTDAATGVTAVTDTPVTDTPATNGGTVAAGDELPDREETESGKTSGTDPVQAADADAAVPLDGTEVDARFDDLLARFDEDALLEQWTKALPTLRRELADRLDAGATVGLYKAQLSTASVLQWAAENGNEAVLRELGEFYALAFPYAEERRQIGYFYVYDPASGKPQRVTQVDQANGTRTWLPESSADGPDPERKLDTGQFLYGVARLNRALAGNAVPVTGFEGESWDLLRGHVSRWVFPETASAGPFQRTGWGCGWGDFDHAEHVENLIERRYGTASLPGVGARPAPAYCNAVTDLDLFVIATVGEMLLANSIDAQRFELSAQRREDMRAYVTRGMALVKSRLSDIAVALPDGSSAAGLLFDRGVWDGYFDMRYSGDTAPSFPGWSDSGGDARRPPAPAVGVGWDLSHARRFVQLTETATALDEAGVVVSDMTAEDVRALALQTVVGTWDGDELAPRFSNYTDGSNGWYRVNYSDRSGYGIAPHAFSSKLVAAGFGAWGCADRHVRDLVLARALADEADPESALSKPWYRAEWIASLMLARCS